MNASPFEVRIDVQKPIADVFDAVYNPEKLKQYFTTKQASGPLQAGSTVTWEFADFPGPFPVRVTASEPLKRIAFEWAASDQTGATNTVEIDFESLSPNATRVKIRESGWRDTPEGTKASYGNCMGWTHMLCCLKAFLDHGIRLREGSFS